MGKNNRKRRAQKKRVKARKRKEYDKKKRMEKDKPLGPVIYHDPNPFAGMS